jgi:hypothetical protein
MSNSTAVLRKGVVTGQRVDYRPRVLHRFGVREIDQIAGGFGAGEVSVIAAKTGAGKTAFGLHLARYHSRLGKNVLYVLAEMLPADTVERLVEGDTGIAWSRIRYAQSDPLTAVEHASVTNAFAIWNHTLQNSGFKIWDSAKRDISPSAVVKEAGRIRNADDVRDHGATPVPFWDIIIIDYWGVLVPAGERDAVALASRTASALERAAQFSRCAPVVLTQLGHEALGQIDAPIALKASLIQGATVVAQKAWRVLFLDRAYGIVQAPANADGTPGKRSFKVLQHAAGIGVVKNRLGQAVVTRVAVPFFCGLYGDEARAALRQFHIDADLKKRAVPMPPCRQDLEDAEQVAERVLADHARLLAGTGK